MVRSIIQFFSVEALLFDNCWINVNANNDLLRGGRICKTTTLPILDSAFLAVGAVVVLRILLLPFDPISEKNTSTI